MRRSLLLRRRFRQGLAVLCATLLAACERSPSAAGDETATLVVTTTMYDGNNDHLYELSVGGRSVAAKVRRSYNPPTGDESFVGDLSAIYEAVAGTSPETPSEYVTVDSILQVLADHGWTIVEDSVKDDRRTSVRTIDLRRRSK